MANKKDNTKRYDVEHLRNLARYRAQVDAIYRELVKEAAAIAVGTAPDFIGEAVDRAVGTAPEDIFSFADYPKTMKRVNALIAAYRADMQKVIVNGVKSEWTLANNKNNELARQVFGGKAGKLTAEQERRYYKNNDTARDAFLGRKERGLSLSDRVWDYSGKFKSEIEMGIDLCLRKGMPAAEMARELQKYLKHPDELFRRVRDEHGILKLSQAAKDYHPGRGVYRSSYKNALRLAITETNMAYRLADWERWQQMDFVVGIRIQLSNNHTCLGPDGLAHPFYDICDELAGDYPKTFKWTGWHPQCRCNAVPILKTVDEKIADNMAKRNGQAPAKESVNSVKKMPKVFTDWVKDNKNRIATAKSQPYFIRDNAAAVSNIIPGVLPDDMMPATPVLPIAERAKMRHDARTAEEIADIRRRWTLREAAIRHAARTPEQIEAIKNEYYARKAVRHYGENIMRYMDGIQDVDTSQLRALLTGGDVNAIMVEASRLHDTGKQILGLVSLDNPMQVARQFSMQKAISINAAVEKKLSEWSGLSLEDQKKKLQFEIKWVEENKKYDTWEVAQKAYQKQLEAVNTKLELISYNWKYDGMMAFKTKSPIFKELMASFKEAINSGDLASIENAYGKANDKMQELIKNKNKASVSFKESAYTQERKDNAFWTKDKQEADAEFREGTVIVWSGAQKMEKIAATKYTEGSGKFNRPLRGYDKNWQTYKGIGKVALDNEGAGKDIENLTNLINRSVSKKDVWLQRGVESTRGMANFLGITQEELNSITSQSAADRLVGKICIDDGFVSCGSAKGTGFSGYILNVYCPNGTKMIYAEPFSFFNGDSCSHTNLWDGIGKYSLGYEFETIIQRGTTFRVSKAEYSNGRLYVDIEVIKQI